MTTAVHIPWGGGEVPGFVAGDGATGVLLAHGAGVGQEHPFMVDLRDGIAGAGFTVMTFDYAYMAAGRRSPDAPRRLLTVHLAAARALAERTERVVLAGKSMGGRMASHLAGGYDGPRGTWDERFAPSGLIFYGYPIVPGGKGDPRPTEHLDRIGCPMLFVTGTRDRLCPLDVINPVIARLPHATGVEVDGGDHSYRVPKSSAKAPADVMAGIVSESTTWLAGL